MIFARRLKSWKMKEFPVFFPAIIQMLLVLDWYMRWRILMYTLNNIDDRFAANCIVKYGRPRVRRFVIDTGARYTCCSYDYINPSL